MLQVSCIFPLLLTLTLLLSALSASPHCIWLRNAGNFSSWHGLFSDNTVLQLQKRVSFTFSYKQLTPTFHFPYYNQFKKGYFSLIGVVQISGLYSNLYAVTLKWGGSFRIRCICLLFERGNALLKIQFLGECFINFETGCRIIIRNGWQEEMTVLFPWDSCVSCQSCGFALGSFSRA